MPLRKPSSAPDAGDANDVRDARLQDVVIVGAGPAGLGAALEVTRRGLRAVTVEEGALAESIRRYPRGMVFFTTRERIEIGGVPLAIPEVKPSREQALAYYRSVALGAGLSLFPYHRVIAVEGEEGGFTVRARRASGAEVEWRAAHVILATGSFQVPNLLGVPGEELAKVSHYYGEGHAHAGCDVLVVGGANSAAEAALDLFRCGARVTLVHRGPELSRGLKYWVGPDLHNRIREGSIRAYLSTKVTRITPASVALRTEAGQSLELPNDAVFAMTGYTPDRQLFRRLGVPYREDTLQPILNPATFESTRAGLYVIGSVVAGRRSGRVFIENGRHHGKVVAEALLRRRRAPRAPP